MVFTLTTYTKTNKHKFNSKFVTLNSFSVYGSLEVLSWITHVSTSWGGLAYEVDQHRFSLFVSQAIAKLYFLCCWTLQRYNFEA